MGLTSCGAWRERQVSTSEKARERGELTSYRTQEGTSEDTKTLRESEGTHFLLSAKGISEDTKRERESEGHSLPIERRRNK